MFFTIHESSLVVSTSREALVSYAYGQEDKTIVEMIRAASPKEVAEWAYHADGVIFV